MSIPHEEWKTVIGFEYYEVSNLARVRSIDRIITYKNGAKRFWPGQEIKPVLKKTGYYQVTLRSGDKSVSKRLHVLVAEHFVAKPSEEHNYVCHIDDIKSNNHATNLYWGTPSDNEQDKIKNGLNFELNKTKCPRGHLLELPNLRKDQLVRGKRNCLACQRTFDYFRRDRPGESFQEVSDRNYLKIKTTV